jgi:hypothetical protein
MATTSKLALVTAGLCACFAFLAASEAPVPGPGGVAIAVRAMLAAQDAGTEVAPLLAEGPNSVDVAFDTDGKLGDFAGGVPVFFDVGHDGSPITAKTPAEFAEACAADHKTGAAVRSVLGGMRATCASEDCSRAVFSFDRVRTVDGREVIEPMRGTAMLRYDAEAKHDFRVYQWHVSRGPVAKEKAR